VADTLGTIHDVREELARDSGAIASLTALAAGRRVECHVHANPYLALHVLGSYRDQGDDGEVWVNGPAALFFPAGSAHQMDIGRAGLATVIIEFDSIMLNRAVAQAVGLKRSLSWVGGNVGRRAHRLARIWLSGATEERRFELTIAFLNAALAARPRALAPSWLAQLEAQIDGLYDAPEVERWAQQVGLTQPRLARAYRHWHGEGLGESIRRRRVEAAAILLESTDLPLADIAAHAGFCDQSHMNRAFRKSLGRTPAATRAARLGLSREQSLTKTLPSAGNSATPYLFT
jgi:AraC family transcriptional regulator